MKTFFSGVVECQSQGSVRLPGRQRGGNSERREGLCDWRQEDRSPSIRSALSALGELGNLTAVMEKRTSTTPRSSSTRTRWLKGSTVWLRFRPPSPSLHPLRFPSQTPADQKLLVPKQTLSWGHRSAAQPPPPSTSCTLTMLTRCVQRAARRASDRCAQSHSRACARATATRRAIAVPCVCKSHSRAQNHSRACARATAAYKSHSQQTWGCKLIQLTFLVFFLARISGYKCWPVIPALKELRQKAHEFEARAGLSSLRAAYDQASKAKPTTKRVWWPRAILLVTSEARCETTVTN